MPEKRPMGMGEAVAQNLSSQLLDRLAVAGHCDLRRT